MDDLALMLVPGLNCTAELYAPQMAALGEGRALVIPDHRSDDRLEAIAARTLAGAPPRFALCGLSMGGYVAFEILRQAPERVTRLALLDTRSRADTADDTQKRERLVALAASGRFGDVHDVLWQRLVHKNRLGDVALEAVVKTMMRDTGPEAFMRQQRALIRRQDYSGMLGSIHVPVLVLVGEQDAITPPEFARDMAARIPGSHLVVVPDCGHMSTLEAPAAVTAALQDWLHS